MTPVQHEGSAAIGAKAIDRLEKKRGSKARGSGSVDEREPARRPSVSELETRLALPPAAGNFGEEELAGLPEPVGRYFRASIAPGTPLATAVRLRMSGSIRIGTRWLPFRGRQVLAPHDGFVWAARVAGGLIRGSDQYADGRGWMSWKLLGLVPMVHSEGSDVSRSAAARAGGEALWIPTALLPRFGTTWHGEDETHIRADLNVGDVEITSRLRLGGDGRPLAVTFDRWGDPDEIGTPALHPFGMEVDDVAAFGGLTIPSRGRAGWFHGTERWEQGMFFRYHITDLRLVGSEAAGVDRGSKDVYT